MPLQFNIHAIKKQDKQEDLANAKNVLKHLKIKL